MIEIKNLTKSYQLTKAVKNLTLSIQRGDFFGFLGPNGAGKTTTIRMLTGILKPDHGEITINNIDISQKKKIAQFIGVIPESRGFYDWMTAFEYLNFFAKLYKIKKDSIIHDLLTRVDLLHHQNQPIKTFSRGMRQRLGLARALINNPQILFLDEPTLGLDPQGQADIHALLQELNQSGVTIFLSSHLLHEVSALCSHIAILHHGQLVSEGTINELRKKNNAAESYYFKIINTDAASQLIKKTPAVSNIKLAQDNLEFTLTSNLEQANALLKKFHAENILILAFNAEYDSLTNLFLTLTSK